MTIRLRARVRVRVRLKLRKAYHVDRVPLRPPTNQSYRHLNARTNERENRTPS